jgi:hypothetical protein
VVRDRIGEAIRKELKGVLPIAGLLFAPLALAQQNLGHKVLGAVGLEAGVQAPAGIYLSDRALFYSASLLRDRDGGEIPVGLDLNAFGNGLGVAAIFELGGLFLTASFALPVAHIQLNTRVPEASIDRFGLGDMYVQPLKLGWRGTHFDLVGGYSLYVPTGRFEPDLSGGVGRGHWTHEFSLGGALYADEARTWRLSALASYDLNLRKRKIDITRGDTVQVQGGLGLTLRRFIDVGVAGYVLWQVSDDSGTELPPQLAGARNQAFGLGPELGVLIPPLRLRVTARYAHDFGVRSRPEGQVFVLGLTYVEPCPSSVPFRRATERLQPHGLASSFSEALGALISHGLRGRPLPPRG